MKKQSFTLIELLTVIAIIAILAGFLLPTVVKVKEKAKQTKARTDMNALKMAIAQYESTYGYLPVPNAATDLLVTNASTPTYTQLITILNGGNARGIQFIEKNTAAGSGYTDPWTSNYNIMIDANYDNSIVVGTYTINGRSAVWASGKNKTNDSGAGDDVRSWE